MDQYLVRALSGCGADRGIGKPGEFSRELGFRTAMDAPGYAAYRDALQTIELACEINQAAALDITDYEEHARSRDLIAAATGELSQAEQAFTQKRFIDSGLLAQGSIRTANRAQRLALEVKRAYQAKQDAATAANIPLLQRVERCIHVVRREAQAKLDERQLVAHACEHVDLFHDIRQNK